VAIIRRDRPHDLITYPDEQGHYPHPDHLRVHDISMLAWERAGDPEWYPEAGEPWVPLKLYYSVWSRARVLAQHEKMLELGLESPFDDEWLNRPSADDRITTRVDVGDYLDVRRKALIAHATQVDPESPFWFALSPEMSKDAYPYDDYILAASRVDTSTPETDLFAGIEPR
jgi:mycothiol S-conjugate amidase